MQKLDRLGWAAGLSVLAYGVRLGVRVTDRAVWERLLERLPPGWRPGTSPVVGRLFSLVVGGAGPRPGVRRLHVAYDNALRLARTSDLQEALDHLEAAMRLHVAERSTRRLFVHAGVVGWKGRALVVPGRSFSGKSSLVAALVKAGATYYSDEYAVFDRRGRVYPFAAPLSLRAEDERRSRRYRAEALGGRVGAKPLPVGLVALSEYRAGRRWRPRRLSPGRGLLALFGNTVPARRDPLRAIATLREVVTAAPIVSGIRGEAEEAARRLLEQTASRLY